MQLSSDPIVTAAIELVVIANQLVAIGVALLTRRRDPSATLSWIIFIVLAPVLGIIAFFTIGRARMRRTMRRVDWAESRLRQVLAKHDTRKMFRDGTRSLDERTETLIQLGNKLATTPASSGNSARALIDGAATYRAITAAIDAAQDHVHVEFYIIQPDAVGRALRERLAAKAAAGVEVRVLYDAIGSRALPSGFWEPLLAAGGKAACFAPLLTRARWRRRDRVDLRNHRKIVVVDASVGFTGGINVGREYLGLDPNIGRWRDAHVQLEGPSVLSLQLAFMQDWLMTTGEALDDERYLANRPSADDCFVQIIDSGPHRTWPALEFYQAQAIMMARTRVWITNPYFIPSQTIESALTLAALRGVDVRLLLPKRSDSRLVTLASRSYYAWLLRAGVRIFEYQRGFVHAKTMVVDDWVATIGSANMDMRSFNLNFELNAFVFDPGLCRDITNQFTLDLKLAIEVTRAAERRTPLATRLAHATARLLSPML
jgi:cardiolipin synthase A/B